MTKLQLLEYLAIDSVPQRRQPTAPIRHWTHHLRTTLQGLIPLFQALPPQ